MAVLQLGVLEVGYSQTENGKTKPTTTFAVATILEENYHVMGTFYRLREAKIAAFLADSMANAFQDRINGRTVGRSPMYDAEQKIEAEFRSFIFANEMNKFSLLLTGQPISAAAARGVNHRRKHPHTMKNPSRPAFVDTGLYVQSFRALFKP